MEIITLVENSCNDGTLKEEFGLSLLIRVEQGTILFDMGASSLFASNAERMGIDLEEVDCAVISHGHYDHGGGLPTFLLKNEDVKVYLGKGANGSFFGNIGAKMNPSLQPFFYPLIKHSKWFSRYIGLEKSALAENEDRFIYIEGCLEIMKDIYLLQEVENRYPLAEGNKYLLEKKDGKLQQDGFDHELIMVIREPDGIVLFTGCGHGGIVNMIKTVQHRFIKEKIKAVVGGFHLSLQPGKPAIAGSIEDIEFIAREIERAGVAKVITGHCTGDDACAILRDKLGEKFTTFSTGFSCFI